MKRQDDKLPADMLQRILDLSWRISIHSPPMKPFIRFSKQMDKIRTQGDIRNSHLFWDFDATLQKILVSAAKEIATPEQISHACVQRWKGNLHDLYKRRQKELDDLMMEKRSAQFQYTPRDDIIFKRIGSGKRVLYLGCGSGRDCLKLASRGYDVVGIDTDFELTEVANQWASYLDLPFEAICMDATKLGFAPKSFDSFILEFYGAQPSSAQALALQRELSDILRNTGMGFIVANRKKYASFWFLMKDDCPPLMERWLQKQCLWDYRLSESDGFEERLMYGLYFKTHTKDSLAAELSCTFNVIDCFYQADDPRYVIALVENKKGSGFTGVSTKINVFEEPEKNCVDFGNSSVQNILGIVGSICAVLEFHEDQVLRFFKHNNFDQGSILAPDMDLSKFVHLLRDAFYVVSRENVTKAHPEPALGIG
ncbi:MAG: class I SAM-dependent methyltransferase [Syntrophorhabdales bacterium]